MADFTVAADMAVTIHYTLLDDDGQVVETSRNGNPMAYLHGRGNLVPGLEAALEGKTAGDEVHADVAPADGYGEIVGPGPQAVPRKEFPKDAKLREGMPFRAAGTDGKEAVLWVTKIKGARVWIDTNHPMAGKNLHFDVSIIAVRPATSEEVSHGHVHGAHGHQH